MNILVTGANGYIGRSIVKGLKGHRVFGLSRDVIDLTISDQVDEWLSSRPFDAIIHCAVKGTTSGGPLKSDDPTILRDNLLMFLNLWKNRDRFDRFIHFGSGSELDSPYTDYGFSKKIINEIGTSYPGFCNLIVFGVFDYREQGTRFIKANLNRYLSNRSLCVKQDRLMDFIYMEDLLSLLQSCLSNPSFPQTFNCCYEEKHSLLSIAHLINSLGEHECPIDIEEKGRAPDYIGNVSSSGHYICAEQGVRRHALWPESPFVGLEKGIQITYQQLLKEGCPAL